MKSIFSRHKTSIQANEPSIVHGSQAVILRESSRYVYRPLKGKNETRFVLLKPGDWDDPIEVDIVTKRINSMKQRYAALSYTWTLHEDDSQIRDCAIRIGDKTILIMKNLYDALRHLRSMQPKKPPPWWIDEISINQDDVFERAQQIPMMPALYSQASHVYCWLGPDDETIKTAFTFFKDWSTSDHTKDNEALQQQELLVNRELKELQDPPIMHAVAALLDRRWFERAWTLPEIVAAIHSHSFFVCGPHMMRVYGLFAGLSAFIYHMPSESNVFIGKRMEMIAAMGNSMVCQIELRRFSDLFHTIAFRSSKDPKDKLFATACMLQDPSTYPKPDYNCSDTTIAMAYTRTAIAVERSLDILRVVLSQDVSVESQGDTPSWCIKLHSDKPPLPLLDPPRKSWTANDMRYFFAATRGQDAQMLNARSENDAELCIKGALIDTIGALIPMSQMQDQFQNESVASGTALEACESILATFELQRFNYQHQCDAIELARTLCCDAFSGEDENVIAEGRTTPVAPAIAKIPVLEREQYLNATSTTTRVWLSFRTRIREIQQRDKPYVHPLIEPDHTDTDARRRPDIIWHTPVQFARHMRKRGYLVVMRSGRLGWTSDHVRQDDEVALLAGSSVPVVLRRAQSTSKMDDRFQLTGEAYLHGVMYGEAWPRELFDIRLI